MSTLTRNAHRGVNKFIPPPPQLASLESAQDTALARAWIEQWRTSEIPKSLVEFSFSRSSGPGGQNVNKVNTKATLWCRIDQSWIPLWAKPALKQSPYYVSSSQSIQISSATFRSQSQNIDECLAKLRALIVQASSSALKNEPSEEQRKHVEALHKAATARRLADKSHRSKIKAARKGRPD
ncbi:RF-1 domain-containing protein [Mycena albidolilacea]|uniref:RF-1 domain-containing protein n=1 Tax=Mycena albidolilacea TaxID=1033008 RepID=A0AAD7A8S0_9AGAR|nr:RF-1 domain-containing protein [Mycena albidolilacea]